MRIDRTGLFLITIFTSLIIIFNVLFLNLNLNDNGISYTGYAVVEPDVEIQLDKESYLPEEELEGSINITFTGNVNKGSTIEVEFNDKSEEVKLTDYLTIINKSYKSTPEEITITNGDDSKQINLTANTDSQIGFKLPQGATVNSVVMSIRGSGTNPTKLLTFDIPEGSEKPEWVYLGPFQSKYGQPVHPEGLDLSSGNSIQYIESNMTYYCQQIAMPFARDFQVSAKYRPVSGSTANLEAVILSYVEGIAEGGADKCSLPRGGADLAWNNCTINFTKGIQGYYLVCLKIDKEERAYEIVRDNAVATSKFNCEMGIEESYGYAVCDQGTSRNYFIRAYPGIYNDNLTTIISTSQFNNWGTDRDLTDSLTAYLSECNADKIGDCPVIMNIRSQTGGSIELRDLRIDYTEEDGGSSYATQFYDLSTTTPEIYEIDNKKLDNKTTLIIPLSFFNTTTPNVTKKQQFELFVSVAGESDTADVEVYSTDIPEGLDEIDQEIADALGDLNTVKTSDMSWILDVENDVLTLTNYKTELEDIRDMNVSMEEKEGRLAVIEDEIRNYIEPLPSAVTKLSETKDTVLVNPTDVEQLFSENTDEIFQYQEKANIAVAVTTYKVTLNDGTSDAYSVIKKTVQPKGSVKDVYVYEVIPKDVAQSTSDIIFERENYEVEQSDPVVKYYFSTLSSTTITYAVKSMVTSQKMYNIKTLIVPKKLPTPEIPQEYECGDGVCSRPDEDETKCPEDCESAMKIPWMWIGIILAALILGILYIYFYRGKGSIGDIRKKLSPFRTEKDLENVKTYIKGQLDKKVKKSEISKALLEKGWTKEQVEYAFEDIKWDKKREETMKKAPVESQDMKKLNDYIMKCKDLKIAEPKITASLKAKGWKETVIKQALLKAGIETNEEEKEKPKTFFEEQVKK